MADSKHRIGRLPVKGPLAHAFDIEWDAEHKSAKITNMNPTYGPDEAEMRELIAHFRAPVTAMDGGEEKGVYYEKEVTLQPGTIEHFVTALYQTPNPFMRMPR